MNTKKFEKRLFKYAPLDDSKPYLIKFYMRGRRMAFCTNQTSKKEAAVVAREIYFHLHNHGWNSTIQKYGNKRAAFTREFRQHIVEQAGNLFDTHCDDIFYFNKGRLYANFLLMRELGKDFDAIIREKGLTNAWNGTVETFRIASQLDPWVVWNGYPDSFLIPNHLAAQGFYLLRARTQLREITAILLK